MRSLKSFAVSLLLLIVGAASLSAQGRVVSGTVLNDGNEPVIGAAVILNGTSNGAVTDLDGKFALDVPEKEVTLNVSCIGYQTKDVKVSAKQDVITIFLAEDKMMLEETVVVGYGTQKKVNLTGAISTVSSKELEDRATPSLTTMLQGSTPGLNITASGGDPGSSSYINIRGITSVNNTDSNPLILIDGVEGELDRVNPNDVESISVIKDAAAAAVYGARAAFGVILVTTKEGKASEGNAVVRYSGRIGWEEPTTSTDYESTGYWSVYTNNLFWNAYNGAQYVKYNEYDMAQLLARVNDKTEHPDRPWVVREVRNGKEEYLYYCNTDWFHELYNDRHPIQQHSVSVSGGNKNVKYYLSGSYNNQIGMMKLNPDDYSKYNLRAKFDFRINKYARISNNTSYFKSSHIYPGVSSVSDSFNSSARHALANFPLRNPDGTWVYQTTWTDYNVAGGRHILFGNDNNINNVGKTEFANTTELKVTPFKSLTLTANYTFRYRNNHSIHRRNGFYYSQYPDEVVWFTNTGVFQNSLTEADNTWNYNSANIYLTYEDTFKGGHHVTLTAGGNYEGQYKKSLEGEGLNLLTDRLNDFSLVGPNELGEIIMSVNGSQSEYALLGFFGRLNYDYKEKYLLEVSGRYDGSSRFAKGSRWGFFPSASAGWRISKEDWFAPLLGTVNNLKIRASLGTLGNQNVSNYAYLRKISVNEFSGDDKYYFGEGSTIDKYTSISAPNAGDLTWETTWQYNVGVDAAFFNNRLDFTAEAYIRDTKDMLAEGVALPSVYGASSPKMNVADLRTKGYELSLSWKDEIKLFGKPFGYFLNGNISDYRSTITKYDNPDRTFAKDYYVGMEFGEIWGYETDGFFLTDDEAAQYSSEVDLALVATRVQGGWKAGDLKYVDRDGDGVISIGKNTVDEPGDRKILGNALATLQYGFGLGFDFLGFDVNATFQGTGDHYWYPDMEFAPFWGPYARPYQTYIPKNFLDMCWSEQNPDAYFPRPRAYSANQPTAPLGQINDKYLQNIRYLRLKNLTAGYTLPQKFTGKIGVEKVRLYFTGENLAYWSPLKKVTAYIDPENAFNRGTSVTNRSTVDRNSDNSGLYPWQKTFMFGIDITF